MKIRVVILPAEVSILFNITCRKKNGNSPRFNLTTYVFRHWRRGGQVIAGGLESVLIGHPVDGDGHSVGRDVRVGSLGDSADILWFLSDLLLRSALLHLGAISAFKANKKSFNQMGVQRRDTLIYLRKVVASISVEFGCRGDNGNRFSSVSVEFSRCGSGSP